MDKKEQEVKIEVPRKLLISADSLLSLVAYRFVDTRITDDLVKEMKEISLSLRTYYEKK